MPRRFDKETRAKAVRLVPDHVGDYGSERRPSGGVCSAGDSAETLRTWIRQAEVDAGEAPGVPTGSAREIRELKRTRAVGAHDRGAYSGDDFLRLSSTFFARERDPLHR